jgi:hypothetical protein
MLNEKTIEDLSKHIDDKLSVLEAMNKFQSPNVASVN